MRTFVLLIVVLLLGFGIRVYSLTLLPVFADEAIYIRWSQIMVSEPTLRFLPLSDGKQPLFMWVLMFFVRRFSDPLFTGRFLSVLSGMGTIAGIFGISYALFRSERAALVASLICALSPFAVFFDRMALVDSMLTFFIVWTFLFGILTAKTGRLDLAMITGFCLGFASLTKSSAIFATVLLPSVWLAASWGPSLAERFGRVARAIFLLGITYGLALAMYNIQRLGPNFHLLTERTKDYVFPLSHVWQRPLDPFVPHFDRAFEWIWIMGPWGLFLLTTYGLLGTNKRNYKEKLLLVVWFLVPLTLQAMFAKTFTARYILFIMPPLYVLAGSAYVGKRELDRKLGVFFLSFFIAQAVLFDGFLLTDPARANLPRSERSGYLEEWTAGTGIKEASEMIRSEQDTYPDRTIVVGTEGFFGTLPDGLQMYLVDRPEITVIGVGLSIGEAHPSLIASRDFGNKTYLLANTSRLNFKKSYEELGLKLVGSWEKAARPDWTREYVKYGEKDKLLLFELIN